VRYWVVESKVIAHLEGEFARAFFIFGFYRDCEEFSCSHVFHGMKALFVNQITSNGLPFWIASLRLV
jgi:hypothetical protein